MSCPKYGERCIEYMCGYSNNGVCMMKKDNKNINIDEIIKKTIEKNGKVTESVVCMEECAELAQAISKEIRGKHDKEHLVEEIADVCICIELLKEIYDITDNDIHNMGIKKLERLERRLKEKNK